MARTSFFLAAPQSTCFYKGFKGFLVNRKIWYIYFDVFFFWHAENNEFSKVFRASFFWPVVIPIILFLAAPEKPCFSNGFQRFLVNRKLSFFLARRNIVFYKGFSHLSFFLEIAV